MSIRMDEADVRLIVRIVLEVLSCIPSHESSAAVAPLSTGMHRYSPPVGRRVVTERDVVDAVSAGRILVPRGCVVTPLARDTAAERGVALVVDG